MSTMYKIFAGNVSFSTTEDQLREVFSPYIEVEDAVIARDAETGKPRGYGFVMTRDAEKARAAMRKVGKVEIDGRLVYFREAGAKSPRGKRPLGRGRRPNFNPRRDRPRSPER